MVTQVEFCIADWGVTKPSLPGGRAILDRVPYAVPFVHYVRCGFLSPWVGV
jgi:hypothetical protein